MRPASGAQQGSKIRAPFGREGGGAGRAAWHHAARTLSPRQRAPDGPRPAPGGAPCLHPLMCFANALQDDARRRLHGRVHGRRRPQLWRVHRHPHPRLPANPGLHKPCLVPRVPSTGAPVKLCTAPPAPSHSFGSRCCGPPAPADLGSTRLSSNYTWGPGALQGRRARRRQGPSRRGWQPGGRRAAAAWSRSGGRPCVQIRRPGTASRPCNSLNVVVPVCVWGRGGRSASSGCSTK